MNKDNPLYAFIQSVEVQKNMQDEIDRKNKVIEQSAKAMNRASNEWR